MTKFIEFLKHLGYDLFYENESLSLVRMTAFWGYLIFILASLYLLIMGKTWEHYSEFSSYLAGTATALLMGNNFVNSKYNSVAGGFGTSDNSISSGRRRPPVPNDSVSHHINQVNEVITNATNKYDQLVSDAKKMSDTIDNAKNTITKFKDGMEEVKDRFTKR